MAMYILLGCLKSTFLFYITLHQSLFYVLETILFYSLPVFFLFTSALSCDFLLEYVWNQVYLDL